MTSLDATTNFGKVEVSGTYSSTDTSISLVTGDGSKLPDPSTDGEYNLVWWDFSNYPDPTEDPDVEIVRVTGKSTDTLTVERGQENTSASAKDTTDATYKMVLSITSKMISDIEYEFNNIDGGSA